MDYNIKDFVEFYCHLYNLTEDDFTPEDVMFIEDTFYAYADSGVLPNFISTRRVN